MVLGFLLAWPRAATSQQARPEPGRLSSPNPLCDGTAVPCLDIDELAAHAYAHVQVLPRTDQRDTAVVLPLGVALGLFGRVAGGVSTHFTFGTGSDGGFQQFGPLRLSLTLRLGPLRPLWSAGSGGDTETTETGQTYYSPPRGLRLGLAYEHEVRVWRFDGANSLGLLTDLAALVQQPLGTRTPDGKYCLVEGEKLPIGENWWRDRRKSVICHDKKLANCLMYRRPHEHGYRVLHRPWVGDDCVLRENVYDPGAPARQHGQTHRTVELAVIGALTKDKTGCADPTGYVHPIGTQYYREHGAAKIGAGRIVAW